MSNTPKTSIYFNCLKCPKSTYPKNKHGFPYSGNTNNPGSLLSPGINRSILINSTVKGRRLKYLNQLSNQYGQRSGTPHGSGSAPKNLF